MKLFFVGILFLLNSLAQEGTLSVSFVGDIMQHGPQIKGAYNKDTDRYDYEPSLQFIRPLIERSDISIANLEVTHAGKPYKGYPQFSAPDELSLAMKNAGFDVLLTANNHSCDGGAKGVIRTLDVLDRHGIVHTGTFRNENERALNYPLIIQENGIKIAILNYTYGTNGLTVNKPLIINYLDSAVMEIDFKKAKQKADYIICTVHWGAEYQSLPNDYQKEWEQYCYELGADMVIGGHPHVVQPIEVKQPSTNGEKKLTVWSLGNFVSNQRDRYKNGGLMVMAKLKKKDEKVNLTKVEHSFFYVHKRQEGIYNHYYILPEFDYNTYRTDFLSEEDLALMEEFFADSRHLFEQHTKGSKEFLPLNDEQLVQLYKKLLGGYYSVLLGNLNNDPKYSKELDQFIDKVILPNGNYAYLSGIGNSRKNAEGQMSFLKDCGIKTPMKIVRVSPTEIKIVE